MIKEEGKSKVASLGRRGPRGVPAEAFCLLRGGQACAPVRTYTCSALLYQCCQLFLMEAQSSLRHTLFTLYLLVPSPSLGGRKPASIEMLVTCVTHSSILSASSSVLGVCPLPDLTEI